MYALYRPDIGYVQGMSYLAGMLSMYLDTYETFICLANMLNTHFFVSLFRMNVKNILNHLKIYDVIFSQRLPQLHAHFKSLGISPEQFLLDWFMTIFSKSMPITVATRIWDAFLNEGEVFLYRAALGILKIYQQELLKGDFEDVIRLLHKIDLSIYDDNQVMASILSVKVPSAIKKQVQQFNLSLPSNILIRIQ